MIGGGPTGVETAGAVADLVNEVMPRRYHDMDVHRSRIYLVDHGQVVLSAFSDKAHAYAADRLQHLGVKLLLGTGVTEVTDDRVKLTDGSEIKTRTVVWSGGIKADAVAGFDQLDRGRAGRLDEPLPDLTVAGHSNVYVIGDVGEHSRPRRTRFPPARVGGAPSRSVGGAEHRRRHRGQAAHALPLPRQRDHGDDRPWCGRPEMGPHHHELHGRVAFAAWLGVHAWLMSGVRNRIDAFVSWAWDFLGSSRERRSSIPRALASIGAMKTK